MKTSGRCDLHVHSRHSDGNLSPEAIVAAADKAGLCAVSITDHDSIDGQDEAIEAGEARPVEVITGIELSVIEAEKDLHILGYLVDHRAGELVSALQDLALSRKSRAERMTELLRGEGVNIGFAEVETEGGGGSLGRPHIARLLLAKGVVSHFQEAFERYLGQGSCCYVPKKVLPLERVTSMIRSAGGVSVWAHPGPAINDGSLLDIMVSAGVDGLEAYHPNHGSSITSRILDVAREQGLVVTGGSDYHFEEAMKVPIGGLDVPCEVVASLRSRASGLSS